MNQRGFATLEVILMVMVIGILASNKTYDAVANRVHNYRDGFVSCDELRFLGNTRPYSWFIQE